MSVFIEKISKLYDIQRYNEYSEFTIPDLNNIKFRFNEDFIYCIDIDIENKSNFINEFNINLIGNYISSIESIKNILKKIKSKETKLDFSLDLNNDPLYLFGNKNSITKNSINRSLVLEKFKSNKKENHINIPSGLKLNHKQVFEMIYTEVEKINKNMSYKHYIDFKDNDPYTLLFRFKYDKGELADKLKKLKDNFGFDYIEVIIKLDSSLYPFKSPTLEYSKPCITSDVIHNMKNTNVFQQDKWNFNISLEWLLKEFAEKYESYFNQYIDITKKYPTISNIEKNIYDLFNLMGINNFNNFNIKFEIPTFTESDQKTKYWGSGTGYGYQGTSDWDINSFIKQQNDLSNEIIKKLKNIKTMFNDCDDKPKIRDIMGVFLTNQFRGTNLFDFNKNINTYEQYILIISDFGLYLDHIKPEVIIGLYEEIEDIMSDSLLLSELSENKKTIYQTFLTLFSFSVKNYKKLKSSIVSDNIKDNYNLMVKENQFGTYVFDNQHLYYKNKNDKINNKKNLLRLISEISSLKKNLPINWDTSCILRVDKKQSNMIKFIITGPKDTPYHNGIYEFHAYFPPTYPNDPPQVLLNTTDGGKVRFNPNLYASGKVCLSLLGTWSGQQGEKWNPDMSTFLQVIISIQSLIMVDDPYFNEPGYEKSMHSTVGKKRAFEYKDNIRHENLRVAILNQIKNPPSGFEEFTINHFKAKKDEIIKMAESWKEETTKKLTIDAFIKQFQELI